MGGMLKFPNINSITISGRLVRDIDIRHTAKNLPVASFCIAVNRFYRDEAGNPVETASFVDVVAFGKTAEICQNQLKKGSPVLVQGDLRTRTYTDQNNQNRKITEVIVDRVYPLERDENYVPTHPVHNQGYGSNNSNTGNTIYGSTPQYNTPAPNNMGYEAESFPEIDYNNLNIKTEDDVPF